MTSSPPIFKPKANTTSKVMLKPTNTLTLASPKQRQGKFFEQSALAYLQSQGLVLISKNWLMPKVGELDLVMMETGSAWDTLVFIEVRQRRLGAFGDAMMSVTPAKQRKIIKTARHFLSENPDYSCYECRFDVVAFTDNHAEPEWLSGAFVASAWR